jgi:chemotaxis family two-component system sensor kinase Cph1
VSDAGLELDLEWCAREPIHVPGTIQPHGALVAFRPDDLVAVRASANARLVLRRDVDDVLGGTAEALLPALPVDALGAEDLSALNPMALHLGDGTPVEAAVHRAGGLLVVEVEPSAPGEEDAFDTSYRRVRSLLRSLQDAAGVADLLERAVAELRALTGFDRVMGYRFDPAWNGEVVAESAVDGLEPFLGLRYPASDIPAQARDLYARTWLRLIPDVDYRPAAILPAAEDVDGGPLDLGDAVLRSVSPVHLEYLRNMGVAASMSVSLRVHGRLWGLLACHQYTGPHRPPLRVRAVAELVGQLVSTLLPPTEAADGADRAARTAAHLARLGEALTAAGDPVDALAEVELDLLGVLDATGAVVRAGGRTLTLGRTPPEALLERAVAAATEPTSALAELDPAFAACAEEASGALVVALGGVAGQHLAWFRPEVREEVRWAGDPGAKVVEVDGRLGPRRSFASWTEEVRGRARPWDDVDLAAADRLARQVTDLLLRAEQSRAEVSATLQRTLLLDSLPDLPGLTVDVRYRPSTGDPVGGDFYDVFWLPGGRAALAVGDVAGHGTAVAPAMVHLRHGLRAYLLKEPSPAAALERLNELLCELLPDDLASVLVIDVDHDGCVRMANAGHLPALVAGPSGARVLDVAHGPTLGLIPGATYTDVEVELGASETLLLYTDGLVERRGESLDVSLTRMRALLGDGVPDLDVLLRDLPVGVDDVTVVSLGRRD